MDPGDPTAVTYDMDRKNPVKQAELWKAVVFKETRQALEWEKSWMLLMKSDKLDLPKEEKPLPTNLSVFSDSYPNTTNQVYGSRQFTPLGKEMVRRDRLILWPGCHRLKKKKN